MSEVRRKDKVFLQESICDASLWYLFADSLSISPGVRYSSLKKYYIWNEDEI